jgi:hypothetical protein
MITTRRASWFGQYAAVGNVDTELIAAPSATHAETAGFCHIFPAARIPISVMPITRV